MLKVTFATSLIIIFYAYLGYPFVLYLFSFFGRLVKKNEILPSVTLFIPAYNEAEVIGQKIENSLNLDYPKEKLQIIVASDGSNDGTGDLVRGFAEKGVLFF